MVNNIGSPSSSPTPKIRCQYITLSLSTPES